MSEGQWMPMDSIPMDGTVVHVPVVQVMRFQPYKPNSEQFRKGIKGRWQRLTEYGGWDSCAAPTGEYWIKPESGEPVKYCHAEITAIGGDVFSDCLEGECSQVKDGKCGGSHDCEHWRPIK